MKRYIYLLPFLALLLSCRKLAVDPDPPVLPRLLKSVQYQNTQLVFTYENRKLTQFTITISGKTQTLIIERKNGVPVRFYEQINGKVGQEFLLETDSQGRVTKEYSPDQQQIATKTIDNGRVSIYNQKRSDSLSTFTYQYDEYGGLMGVQWALGPFRSSRYFNTTKDTKSPLYFLNESAGLLFPSLLAMQSEPTFGDLFELLLLSRDAITNEIDAANNTMFLFDYQYEEAHAKFRLTNKEDGQADAIYIYYYDWASSSSSKKPVFLPMPNHTIRFTYY